MKLHRFLVAVVLLYTAVVFAQQAAPPKPVQAVVPRLIRFTGQVKDASGTVGITFSLHRSQDDNAALWIETQSVPLDASGKYTVLLGATQSEGIPMDLFASGEAQWLAIQVEGKAEQPRVLLVSVPYALKAAEAETLAGHSANEFVTADTLTTAVQQQLHTQPGLSGLSATASGTQLNPLAVSSGPTNFSGNTTDQVVKVTQSNTTGSGLVVSAPATAIKATSTATTGTPAAVRGFAAAPAGAGVFGSNIATTGGSIGVHGSSASGGGGIGVYGNNTATTGAGFGVKGQSASTGGTAIVAAETAASGNTTGLLSSIDSPGGTAAILRASTISGKLLSGQAGASHSEVFSIDTAGNVVSSGQLKATTTDPIAVFGTSTNSAGVEGFSTKGDGVMGMTYAPGGFGLYGWNAAGAGVFAGTSAAGGTALYADAGSSTGSNGVLAHGATAVSGYATVNGSIGVNGDAGSSSGSRGVNGSGEIGVKGQSSVSGSSGFGVYGTGTTGVYGTGTTYGLFGIGPTGVFGNGNPAINASGSTMGGTAISATVTNGVGLGATVIGSGGWALDTFGTPDGYAAWFNGHTQVYAGDLDVGGTLTAATKHFKIDHPLDPTNKYLMHASVESSEMMNIYSGNVTTDSRGEARVELPRWFDALNGDFRYQLTPIGVFAQAIVSQEIADNEFTIKTDKPNVKVSWQVTAVRRDAYAKAHPMQVEVEKPEVEKGSYLYPEAFGQPEERSMGWARRPAAMQHWREARAMGHAKNVENAPSSTAVLK